MAETAKVQVNQDNLRSASEETEIEVKGNKRGEVCIVDFYTQMALEGRAFQIRAGTITTPITADIEITDTKAEMAVDCQSGLTIIPVYFNAHIEANGGGTLPTVALKSVASLSTARTTVFIPLPLYMGGNAAQTTAGVGTAGGVTVTAELATTTIRHYSITALSTAIGKLPITQWEPRCPPVLPGASCFYVQVAGVGAGPTYFAHFDYIELPTVNVS